MKALYASVCACIGVSGTAYGQEPPATADSLEQIVVTGSRIVRRDLEAPSPIVTVDAEAFDQSSNFAVETVLNQYPQFAPADSQFTAADVQPQPGSSPGVSTLDLRNLGPGRSLVLLDGRRAQPVNAGMTVDVNMIPSALISNVEVISGGAAATYGPDAMAGVVNFRLKTDFEGIALNYQGGWTDIGDGGETRADALIGGNFDRGNAVVAISYADRDLAYQNNRDFYVDIWNDPGTPANYPRVGFPHWTPDPTNRASQAAMDQVFPTPGQSPTPDIYINPATGSVFRLARALTTGGYDGPTDFPYKIRTHNGNLEQTNPRSYLSSALTRYSAFGRATYEVMENVNFFAQGMFVQSTVNAKGPPTPMTGGVLVPRDPANEAAELTILLDSRPRPQDPWRVTRVGYWKDNRATTNRTKLNEIVLGFNGNIGASDWTYEAYTQYGSTVLLTQQDNFMWMDRYNALAAQPNFGRGGSITVNAANEHLLTKELTCTSGLPVMEDYHIDLEGNINYTSGFELSQDCWEATSANMLQQNLVEQRVTEANFQGKVLDMPGGELRGAFGISQRNNSSDYRPDELFLASTDASGETDVMEYYGELLIPVTERFELEVGSRLSDFETGGFSQDAKSHKALFSWQAADVLRFRGGWQRAGRTPNVAELYAGSSSAVAGGDDPCRVDTNLAWSNVPSNPNREQVQQLCAELNYRSGAPVGNRFDVDPDNFPSDGATTADVYRLFSEGNPRLKPETADTLTFGAVWQAANRDLTLSADWYEIDIQDVVGDLDFPTAHEQCFNASGGSNPTYDINNEYCQRIWRDPVTANASYVRGGNFNLSERFTSGIDYSLSWSAPLANFGLDGPAEIGIRTSVNVLLSWKEPESASPEAPLREFAGYGTNFDYKVFTTFSYARDALNVSLNWRHLPSSEAGARATNPLNTTEDADSYNVFNLNGAWRFNDMFRLRVGIDNLLDEEPVITNRNVLAANPNNGSGTSAGDYDVLGRRYFIGLSVDF